MVEAITLETWEYLVARGLPVGRCPVDGGDMFGDEPIETKSGVWLDSRCVICQHEVSAPGGRRLQARTVVPFRRRPVAQVDRDLDWAERAVGDR